MGHFTTSKTTKKRDQLISRQQVEISSLKSEIHRLQMVLDLWRQEHDEEIKELHNQFHERHRVVMAQNEMLMESLAGNHIRNTNPSFVVEKESHWLIGGHDANFLIDSIVDTVSGGRGD
jgi:hypothetical protein